MRRFRRVQAETRTWPPVPVPGWTPWLRFDIEPPGGQRLLDRLVAAPVTVEVETASTQDRLLGRVTPHGQHEARITDNDGQVHDTHFDVAAVRLRLDEDNSEAALRLAFYDPVAGTSLLGFQLATGELRIGVAVAFEIPEDCYRQSLGEPEKSSVHVLSIPLEALSTEDIWTMMRLAMYDAAQRLRDNWKCHERYFRHGYYVDRYRLDELLAISDLERAEGVGYWRTSVVPAFDLQRPVAERNRLWFVDDASQPIRRGEVSSPKRLGDRWPDIRGFTGGQDDVYPPGALKHLDELVSADELLADLGSGAELATETGGRP